MSIATTIGTGLGYSGAYAKHAALRAVQGSGSFVAEVYASTLTSYAAKDAELAERREQLALARQQAAVALPKPTVKRQRRVNVA